jgi:hypothetical protein
MVGAPGEQRVATRLPTGHDAEAPPDDTTSAQLRPLAAPPAEALRAGDLASDDEAEPEERTMQQAVPPTVAAAVAATPRAAAPVVPAKPTSKPRPVSAPIGRAKDAVADAKARADDDDDEPLEDSITATAPRLNAATLMDAAQSGRGVPLSIPGRVEIRTLEEDDDEEGDKTEVRARPGQAVFDVPLTLRGAAALPAPRPAAGRPPDAAPEIDAEPDDGPDDDGPTTQAAAPRLGSVPDIGAPILVATKTRAADAVAVSQPVPTQHAAQLAGVRLPASPKAVIVEEAPTRPGVPDEPDDLLTRPGVASELEPATHPGLGGASERDDDLSVTSRAPNAEPYGDDSVTTQAPNVPVELIHAAIKAAEVATADGSLDDTSAATTKKVRKPARPGASPADEEAESITTQAPGHVTNMLRVIASGSSPDLGKDKAAAAIEDDDDEPENRTAVMANAPLKRVIQEVESAARLPAIRPTGGPLSHGPMGAAAPRLEPSSESGLRVARTGSSSNERASLGQLMAAGDARGSLGMPAAPLSDGAMSAANDSRGHLDLGPLQVHPSMHDADLGKGPSYGLLVAIVAFISIAVPVTLFVVLRHGADPAAAQEAPSEPVSEVAKPSAARGKAPRGRNGLTILPSASVSAAPPPPPPPSSSASGKPGPKPPFGKR